MSAEIVLNQGVRKRLEQALAQIQQGSVNPKRSLGQNFLVSDIVVNRIYSTIKTIEAEKIIEIGPGPGALTDLLLTLDKELLVIELDRDFAEYWRQKDLNVLEQDALSSDWVALSKADGKCIVVGNLPYQISSSLVIDRSMDKWGQHFANMVFMFQKEVAERITSPTRSKSYGLLSVIAQVFWKIKRVIDAGPREFWPAPQVSSRVLQFERIEQADLHQEKFLSFVKAAFSQRRKLLKSNLSSYVGEKGDQVLKWLSQNGFTDKARAEELTPDEFKKLFKHLGY